MLLMLVIQHSIKELEYNFCLILGFEQKLLLKISLKDWYSSTL